MGSSAHSAYATLHGLAAFLRGQWGLAIAFPLLGLFWVFQGEAAPWFALIAAPLAYGLSWAPVLLPRALAPPKCQARQQLRAAMDRSEDGAAKGKEVICILLHLDDTPRLLDEHAPAELDQILSELMVRGRHALRPDDTLVRLAPDQLGVSLAPAARYDLETALQVAARLQASLSQPLTLARKRHCLSFSVGISLSQNAPGASAEDVLTRAETALTKAQAAGAGSIRVYEDSTAPAAKPGTEQVFELLDALETGQIRPWYQPQLSNDTGDISGMEALARWHHPTRGTLSPAVFLPIVETSGRQERLGEVMRRHAYTALRSWDRAGLDIPSVGINVTLPELQNPAFADKIAWELDAADLLPHRLTLEILETVVSSPQGDAVARNLTTLASYGCGIDLDDFGTGHASITSLRRFPVQRIKIDRSFVSGADIDRNQQQMVSAIVTMAERLGLETVAEGVETAGEHAMLAQLGCTHVQGFGLARPMPFEDTPGWLQRHRSRLPKPSPLQRKHG